VPALRAPELTQTVAERTATAARHLITTRLDNDDAVAREFCARIRAEYRGRVEVLNFTRGAQYHRGRIYTRLDPSNSFASLVAANVAEPLTVYADRHDRLSNLASIRQIKDHPMWLQVIHGRNINQPIAGIRARPGPVCEHFGIDVPVVPPGPEAYLDGLRSAARLAVKVARPSGLRRLARVIGRP
jgi:hypothetical protein